MDDPQVQEDMETCAALYGNVSWPKGRLSPDRPSDLQSRISTGCRVQIQGSRGGPSGGFPGAMVGNGVQLLTCHPVLIP